MSIVVNTMYVCTLYIHTYWVAWVAVLLREFFSESEGFFVFQGTIGRMFGVIRIRIKLLLNLFTNYNQIIGHAKHHSRNVEI